MSDEPPAFQGVKVKVVDGGGNPIPNAVVKFVGKWGRSKANQRGRHDRGKWDSRSGGPQTDDRVITIAVSLDGSKGKKERFAWQDGRTFEIVLDDVSPPATPSAGRRLFWVPSYAGQATTGALPTGNPMLTETTSCYFERMPPKKVGLKAIDAVQEDRFLALSAPFAGSVLKSSKGSIPAGWLLVRPALIQPLAPAVLSCRARPQH